MPHLVVTAHSLSNKGCTISRDGMSYEIPNSILEQHIIFCQKHSPSPCSCTRLASKSSPLAVLNALEMDGWTVKTCYSYAIDNQKHAWILHKNDEKSTIDSPAQLTQSLL
ncbi:unnamed protein product, partial [Mesorhabditis belari]|uniref:Uncharacterized protein n=1 Tax=Mesorhabditis belari TaxID=2138241 RepID=A0AAF3FBP7_9BILA